MININRNNLASTHGRTKTPMATYDDQTRQGTKTAATTATSCLPLQRERMQRKGRATTEMTDPEKKSRHLRTYQQYWYNHNIHTLWKSLSETTALIDDRSISPHTTHIATDVNTNLYLYSNQRMILQHAYFARVYSTYIQLDFQLRAMDGRINMGNCTNNFV